MLIRLLAYIVCMVVTWHMGEYVFTRNLMQGLYPPEADSIGIPIFENQLAVILIGVIVLPTCVLGNTWLIKKLAAASRLVQVLVAIPFAGIYALSILITWAQTWPWLNKPHIELGSCFGVLLFLTITFALWDARRFYRDILKTRLVVQTNLA
jgi:hypothetical protein